MLRLHAAPLADTHAGTGQAARRLGVRVDRSADVFDYHADPALLAGTEADASRVSHEPAGLAVAVVPNDHPVTLLAYELAPVLAAARQNDVPCG